MFFVFEGVDGSGKSTQARRLAEELKRTHGFDVLLVREPGGTALGEKLRELILEPQWGDLAPETELFLFMAARSHLTRTVIRPAIEAGRVVISDRYLWSSAVYQSASSDLTAEEILRMGSLAVAGVSVTRTFLVDLDPDIAFTRVQDRNRMEDRGIEFQRRVRAGFLALAETFRESTSVIDGLGSPEVVLGRVLSSLSPGELSPQDFFTRNAQDRR